MQHKVSSNNIHQVHPASTFPKKKMENCINIPSCSKYFLCISVTRGKDILPVLLLQVDASAKNTFHKQSLVLCLVFKLWVDIGTSQNMMSGH